MLLRSMAPRAGNLGLMNQPRKGRVKVRPLRNSVSPTLLALVRAVLCFRTGAPLLSCDREWIHMHQAASHGYIDRFCAPGNLQLFQNVCDVYLDSRLADVKQGTDLFVAFTSWSTRESLPVLSPSMLCQRLACPICRHRRWDPSPPLRHGTNTLHQFT